MFVFACFLNGSVVPNLSQLQQTSNHASVSRWAELRRALCIPWRISEYQNYVGCAGESRVEA